MAHSYQLPRHFRVFQTTVYPASQAVLSQALSTGHSRHASPFTTVVKTASLPTEHHYSLHYKPSKWPHYTAFERRSKTKTVSFSPACKTSGSSYRRLPSLFPAVFRVKAYIYIVCIGHQHLTNVNLVVCCSIYYYCYLIHIFSHCLQLLRCLCIYCHKHFKLHYCMLMLC